MVVQTHPCHWFAFGELLSAAGVEVPFFHDHLTAPWPGLGPV